MSLTWKFEVKWDGTNWVDEAARMRGLTTWRGRQHFVAPGGRGLEPMPAGEAVVPMVDVDGRYNPYNASSPLYGDIAPGKLARITVTHTTPVTWNSENSGSNHLFNGIWGAAADDVYVSENNGVWHWDGSAWSLVDACVAYAIYGLSASNVVVVGFNGMIRKYNGSTWSAMTSGTTTALYAVWAYDANNWFAGGEDGTILCYNGSEWSAMTSGITEGIRGIWGTAANNVYAVGTAGTILHYNGSAWSEMDSGVAVCLEKIWGTSNSDIYVTGLAGTILHFDGSTWSTMTSGTSEVLRAIWGYGSSVWVGGANGTILKYDGSVWTAQNSGSTQIMQAAWGTSALDIYMVGYSIIIVGGEAQGTGAILHMSQTATTYAVFAGKLDVVQPGEGSGKPYATLTIRDGMDYLQNNTVFVDNMYGALGATVSTVIAALLTEANWPWGTDLATLPDNITWWGGDYYDKPVMTLISELRNSHLGEFFVAADGKATYLDRLSEMPAYSIELTDDDIQMDFKLPMPWENVINECVVRWSRWYASGSLVVLYSMTNMMEIEMGDYFDSGRQRLTYNGMWASGKYKQDDESKFEIWDYEHGMMDKDGPARWTAPTVSPSSTTTAFVDVKIKNQYNTDLRLTKLLLYFNPAAWFDICCSRAVVDDDDSVAAYGERLLTIDGRWLFGGDEFSGADMAASVVASLKNPRCYPTVKIKNDPAKQFGLELRDVIRINSTTMMLTDEDYHIGQIQHKWMDETGQLVETTIKTEPCIIEGTGTTASSADDPEGEPADTADGLVDDLVVEGDLTVAGTLTLASGASVNDISNDDTLADASDTALVTEGAAKAYTDTKFASSASKLVGSDGSPDPALSADADGNLTAVANVAVRGLVLTEGSVLTIASDTITVTNSFHKIDTEGGAATDNLATINGGESGQRITLKTVSSTRDVTMKDGTGNLNLAGDFLMDNSADTIELIKYGTGWLEVSRSNNA